MPSASSTPVSRVTVGFLVTRRAEQSIVVTSTPTLATAGRRTATARFRDACLRMMAGLVLLASSTVTAAEVDFQRDIRPLLDQHCGKCHGSAKQQGGLRFDVRSGAVREGDSGEHAVVPGHADDSELVRRVVTDDDSLRMPPEDASLSAAQIKLLRRWISEGARWPEDSSAAAAQAAAPQELVVSDADRRHWAFAPLRGVDPPQVGNPQWVQTPIDRFVLAALEARGLQPTAAADARRLVRRMMFDMTGLPPQPEAAEPFVDSSSSFESLIERLLASEHYGERWGRHWLDVARYADSNGQEGDQDRPHAYQYRDFVIAAINEDLPFDQFVRWQLAGDELDPDNPLAVAATGFLTAGPHTVLNVPMEEEKIRNRYNELDDMLSTIGVGMLGLTVGCARCHDHKFDAIPTRDYYRMLSALHSGDRQGVLLGPRVKVEQYRRAHAAWESELKQVEAQLDDWLQEHTRPLEPELRSRKIDELTISDEDKKLLREQPDSDVAKKLVKQHEKALAISDDQWRTAMTDEQRRQWAVMAAAVAAVKVQEPPSPPAALAFRDFGSEPRPTWLFHRGDFYQRDEPVQLGFLSVVLSGKSAEDYWRDARAQQPLADSTYQRKALALWITDTQHGAGSLLARVIVNRVWQHHFGEGIVRTVSDFGVQGERPSHPELLEWLAHDFVAHGWQLKRLHRMILRSATYQQGSQYDAAKATLDPDNRLLWRKPLRRLEAEALRDSMLVVSGTLNPQPFGPAFKPPIAAEAMVARNLKTAYIPEAADSTAVLRRSVYMFHKRVVPYPLLQAFDAPDASQSCGRRNNTIVAPQALMLFNDPFVRARAIDFAARVAAEARQRVPSSASFGSDEGQAEVTQPWIELAFQLAFCRPPSGDESAAAAQFLQTQIQRRVSRSPDQSLEQSRRLALADFCQTLFSLNEFIYVD